LFIVRDGTIYPIEIRKTSSPNLKDIKHFKNLQSAYPDMKIGQGRSSLPLQKSVAIRGE
jgi:hypothetical protein